MMIQAYCITENERVHIPVNVCYGGCIEKLEQAKSKPGAKEKNRASVRERPYERPPWNIETV